MTLFTRQTLAQLRQSVGLLTRYMVKGSITSGTARGFFAPFVKLKADDHFVGKIVYIVSGTGIGQSRVVDSSIQSSGGLTVTPTWTTQPDATSVVEVWDSPFTVERVNNAINLAILNVQDYVLVRKRVHPTTVDAEGKILTIPDGFKYISRISYLNPDSVPPIITFSLTRDPGFMYDDQYNARLYGNLIYFQPYINSTVAADVTKIWIEGHGIPDTVVNDSDYVDVRGDYIVNYASFVLEAGESQGGQLDPEEHSGRASNWLREAVTARQGMFDPPDPNAIEVVL